MSVGKGTEELARPAAIGREGILAADDSGRDYRRANRQPRIKAAGNAKADDAGAPISHGAG